MEWDRVDNERVRVCEGEIVKKKGGWRERIIRQWKTVDEWHAQGGTVGTEIRARKDSDWDNNDDAGKRGKVRNPRRGCEIHEMVNTKVRVKIERMHVELRAKDNEGK